MANPNILTASSVVGVTTFFPTRELQTRSTDTSSLYYQYNVPIYNPAGSGKIIKIEEIFAFSYSTPKAFKVSLILDLTSTGTNNSRFLAQTAQTLSTNESVRILNKNPGTVVGSGTSTIDMEYLYVIENQGIEVSTTASASPGPYYVMFTYQEISS